MGAGALSFHNIIHVLQVTREAYPQHPTTAMSVGISLTCRRKGGKFKRELSFVTPRWKFIFSPLPLFSVLMEF